MPVKQEILSIRWAVFVAVHCIWIKLIQTHHTWVDKHGQIATKVQFRDQNNVKKVTSKTYILANVCRRKSSVELCGSGGERSYKK